MFLTTENSLKTAYPALERDVFVPLSFSGSLAWCHSYYGKTHLWFLFNAQLQFCGIPRMGQSNINLGTEGVPNSMGSPVLCYTDYQYSLVCT